MQAESIPQNQINAALAALAARQNHPELTGSTVAQYNAARNVLDAMAEGMPMDKALKAHSKGARGRTVDPSEVVTAALTVAQHQFASTPVTEGPAADVVANAPVVVAPVAEGTEPTPEGLAKQAAERLARLQERVEALVENETVARDIAELEEALDGVGESGSTEPRFIDVGPAAVGKPSGLSFFPEAYAGELPEKSIAPPADVVAEHKTVTVAELFGALDVEGRNEAIATAISSTDDVEARKQLQEISSLVIYDRKEVNVEGIALAALQTAVKNQNELAQSSTLPVAETQTAENTVLSTLWNLTGEWISSHFSAQAEEPNPVGLPKDELLETPVEQAAPLAEELLDALEAPEPVVSETPDSVTHEVATESEAPLAVEAVEIAAPTTALPASRPTDPFADAAVVPAARPAPEEVVAASAPDASITESVEFTTEQAAALEEVAEHITRDGNLSGSFLVAVDGDGWFSKPTISLVTTGPDGTLQVIANPTVAQAKGASLDDSAQSFLSAAFDRATRAGETTADLSMGDNIEVNAEWTGGTAFNRQMQFTMM